MRALILFALGFQLAYGSCPTGFDLVRDGECRGNLTVATVYFEKGTTTAIQKCAEIDAQPIIIHDEEHQTYWKGQAPSTYDGFLFIGIVCNTQSKKWEWSDGSALDYKPKTGYNEELDKPCTPGFGWDIHQDGFWSYGNNGQVTAYISCAKPVSPHSPMDAVCSGFENEDVDAVCYQVAATTGTWREAQEMCESVDANLASIHNLRENSFIRRLAVTQGALSGVFIGASISSGFQGQYGWVDGSVWDYDNYYPGFPKKGLGDCIAMDTSSTDGQWMNVDCKAKLPVACIRKQNAVIEPTCKEDYWLEDTTITSPGYPFSASTPCDYILNVDAGKKVKVELQLEANSCCDSLSIYDGYLGGKLLAKLTGDIGNATYTTETQSTMRVSWQPKGGANVKGLSMKFHAV